MLSIALLCLLSLGIGFRASTAEDIDSQAELAAAGNYTFSAHFSGTIVQNTTAGSWLDCHDKCSRLNENSYCNVFSFCQLNCTDGFSGFNIPNGTCYLKIQSDLTATGQIPQRLPDAKDGVSDPTLRTNLGSGVVIPDTMLLDRFRVAGNLTWNVAYDAQIYRLSNASSPYDCYQQCMDYNEQPEGYANTYMYCAVNTTAGCIVASRESNTTLQYGQCACQVQSGFTSPDQQPRQVTYLPAVSALDVQTNVASGVIFSSKAPGNLSAVEKFASIGSLRLNTEYDGILQSFIPKQTAWECLDACSPGCNVFVFCMADTCRTNISASPIPKGWCQLKNQQSVHSESDRPVAISNSTNLSSGIYIAPPQKNTGVIVGSVAGGLAVFGVAVAGLVFGLRRRWRRQARIQALLTEIQPFTIDVEDTELVSVHDLPPLATAKIELGIQEYVPKSNRKPKLAIETAHRRQAIVFDDTPEAGTGDFELPGITSDSLENTWRIEPDHLKCRRKADGKMCLLGRGGSGAVYLGVLHGATDVAIKVTTTPSPDQCTNFIREIMILKACRHPNIISFLGASIQGQQTLLVMEAMAGGDLLTLIQNDYSGRYLWYKRGREIAMDVLRGLTFFHAHSILHLDLKSPNILLNGAAAKIADVGLGRKVRRGEKAAKANGASIPWCAPEQLRGEPCTPATDMFALGVILWELCTGEQPCERRHYRPVHAPKEAPAAIVQLIHSCMSATPEQRPTAAEAHTVITFCGLKSLQPNE